MRANKAHPGPADLLSKKHRDTAEGEMGGNRP